MTRALLCLAGCLIVVACGREETPTTAPTMVIGGPGRSDGRFTTPRGICVDSDGAWVVDRSGRIQRFDSDGGFVKSLQISEKRAGFPLGLLPWPGGGFLLCDTHGNRLRRFDGEGREVLAYASGLELSLPQRATRDEKGRLLVTEFGSGRDCRVRILDSEGQEQRRFGHYGNDEQGFTRPMGIAILDDRIYVADTSDRILVHDLDGAFLFAIGSSGSEVGQLRYPYGLCAHEDTLIVCEYANHRLQRFSKDGRSLGTYGQAGRGDGCFSGPWDLTTDPEGKRLWVCDAGNHRVVVLDATTIPWKGGS